MARDLGIWDVQGLLRVMSGAQFGEWAAFYQLEADLMEEARTRAELKAEAERGLR